MGTLARSLLAALALPSGVALAAQHPDKLNAPLQAPGNVVGDVTDARLSPDGRWAVYVASQDTVGAFELYAVPLDGSAAPVKLSAPLVSGREISRVAISPDSRWVAYRADQDEPSLFELYGVPLDGSAAPVKLNPPVLPNADVGPELHITERGLVLFKVHNRLFAAPVDGRSAATDISGHLGPSGYVYEFEPAPGGERVVFSGRIEDGLPRGIFSVSLAGLELPHATRPAPRQTRVRLSNALVGDVTTFRISPDGQRVAFQTMAAGWPLFGVSIGGGPVLPLSGPLPAGGRLGFHDFQISADSSRVVYRADQDVVGTNELYSRPLDASAPASKLNAALAANGDVHSFALSPDASRVVYLADQDTDNVLELYSAPLAGGGVPVKLFSAQPDESLTLHPYLISPDGQRVVYLTTSAYGDHYVYRLRSVPIAGGAPALQLNGAHLEYPEEDEDDPQVWAYQISPDSRRVVYLTDEDEDDLFELYSTPIDVGLGSGRVRRAPPVGAVKLNRPLPDNGEVGEHEENAFDFGITADGAQVVYRASQETRFVHELYRVPIDRSQGPVRLNPTLVVGSTPSDVESFQVSADSAWVVYRADPEIDQDQGLYAVPSDAGAPSVRLDASPGGGSGDDGSVDAFALAAGSARVAYLATLDGTSRLFGAAIGGGAGPLELSGALVPGGRVVSFELEPSGGRVVYRADQDEDERYELFSAPLDGSAGAVRLSGTLVPGGDADWCNGELAHVTVGSRLVYRADQEVDERIELYSVPTDGSAPPVKLNAPFHAGADVGCAVLSPDGSRVVYSADQDTDNVVELYSVPSDGSAAPVKLNPTFVPGRQALAVRITPDGARVLYLADQVTDDVFELFSVPIDGSAAALELSGALVAGGDVQTDFQGSADGAWVVYRADQARNDRQELYAVPSDGSLPAVRLNPGLANDRDVSAFQISPDGARVVYVANQAVAGEQELHGVPIDGSAPAVVLNAPLVPLGDVRSFEIDPLSGHVVYVANQLSPTFELFRVPIQGGAEPRRVSGPMGVNGDVGFESFRFRTTPDGRRVVYLADQEVDERTELYSARVTPRLARAP
jgi:Tol biopolymer transport system component